MKRVTLIGDSHAQFLGSYVSKNSVPSIVVKYCNGARLLEPFAASDGSGRIAWTNELVAERYGAAFENQPGLQIVFSSGASLSIIARDPMWRTHAPWRIAGEHNLHPVSDKLMQKMINDMVAPAISFLHLLKAEGFEVAYLEPPPLKRTHPGLVDGTDPAVLLAFDHQWREIMREACRALSIPWIEPPPISIDADGFMKHEYSFSPEDDPHHANAAYSALIIAHLQEFAGLEVA